MTPLLTRPQTDAPLDSRDGSGPVVCSEQACGVGDTRPCSYVDRRQRHCPTAWCGAHGRAFLGSTYCRRHVSVVVALAGDPSVCQSTPDLENRAPPLASWVGGDLDVPIRAPLQTHFLSQRTNDSRLVNGGSAHQRTWGRSWKLLSPNGVDLSVTVTVPENDDSTVLVTYDGTVISEQTPPWIENRRAGEATNREADLEGRRAFYGRIVDGLEVAMIASKRAPHQW